MLNNTIAISSLSIILGISLSGCVSLTKKDEITYIEPNFLRVNKNYVEKKMLINPNDEVLNFQKLDVDYVEKKKEDVKKITPIKEKKKAIIKEKVKEDTIIDKTVVKTPSEITESELAKLFFISARSEIENIRKEFAKTLPNTLRAGLFDLSQPGQKNKYNDSNYFAREKFLTTTYRPKTLYGNDFNNYIAYCPIFFNWENKTDIANYFRQFNLEHDKSENNEGISFTDLTKYVIGVNYGHCLSFNEAYKGRSRSLSEKESIEVADLFLIGLFTQKGNLPMAEFIINNNHLLHKNNYAPNKEKLNNFYMLIKNTSLVSNSDYYKVWKLSYNYSLKNR